MILLASLKSLTPNLSLQEGRNNFAVFWGPHGTKKRRNKSVGTPLSIVNNYKTRLLGAFYSLRARQWLVDKGIANPYQVLLTGRSYGGYNTPQALGRQPDLWAGGMAGVVIANWAAMYEDSAGAMRGYIVAFFGGVPEDRLEQFALSSPITYANNVRAPVFIFQGRSDTRTPARQVEMYEARLKAFGKPVEVFWFDSGHLRVGVEEDIQNQERMLHFARGVLGFSLLGGGLRDMLDPRLPK